MEVRDTPFHRDGEQKFKIIIKQQNADRQYKTANYETYYSHPRK